ncbi:hypothetical protein BaRGS_00017792 [Batillaria attramentaria]|uniref:G-protein coupled receptors family 1 profile domain-containing protein n=1 Tax=Batillaria attramentaria TaxID=370345 RepID=A0ABD0KUS3_9CAEN
MASAALLCVLLHMCYLQKPGMEEDCHAVVQWPGGEMNNSDAMPHRPVQAVIGMLSFFSVLGTLGNALVLYVYVRKKNKIASTIFIICLAATDFVTSCVIMPFTMVMESVDYAIEHDALCKIYFFLITCNVPFSAFIMVAIAIDRYLCICRPHCHVLDSRRSQIVIVFLLLVACGLGVMTALFHGVYIKGPIPNWTNKTDEQVRDSLRGELRDTLDDIEPTPPMAQSDWCGDEEAENKYVKRHI